MQRWKPLIPIIRLLTISTIGLTVEYCWSSNEAILIPHLLRHGVVSSLASLIYVINPSVGFPIDLVYIKNRACLDEESKGCLCRLSEAIVILYDEVGAPVYTKMFGDMCGEYDWTYEYAKSSEYCKVFDG